MLRDLDMYKQLDTKANALSGGQQRKLCLGMALVGDTKVLYLDEATSGVDPESRTHFWDLLRKYRQERIVVCTTHFLDEADYLADKVAIISDGKLLACDSPAALKNTYGNGYKLTIGHQDLSMLCGSNYANITELLEKYVPEVVDYNNDDNSTYNSKNFAQTQNHAGKILSEKTNKNKISSLTYGIPYNRTKEVENFFKEFEYRFPGYIIRFEMADLESVFLKIVNKPVDPLQLRVLTHKGEKRGKFSYILSAMLQKRFLYSKHEWILWIGGMVLAVLFTLVPLLLG